METRTTQTQFQLAVLGERREIDTFDDSVGHLHFDRQARAWRTPAEARGLNAPGRETATGDLRCA